MNEIEEFLALNKLKQIQLAEFLGMDKSSISQAVSGKMRLSQAKINQILMNKNGWDCSMFDRASVVQKIGDNSNNNTQSVGDSDLYKRLCEEKDKRIAELERTIQILLAR